MSKKEVYEMWKKYAKEIFGRSFPPPEYEVEAYTDETICTWLDALIKYGYIKAWTLLNE